MGPSVWNSWVHQYIILYIGLVVRIIDQINKTRLRHGSLYEEMGKGKYIQWGWTDRKDVLENDLCWPSSFWKPTSVNSCELRESLSRFHGAEVPWNSVLCFRLQMNFTGHRRAVEGKDSPCITEGSFTLLLKGKSKRLHPRHRLPGFCIITFLYNLSPQSASSMINASTSIVIHF